MADSEFTQSTQLSQTQLYGPVIGWIRRGIHSSHSRTRNMVRLAVSCAAKADHHQCPLPGSPVVSRHHVPGVARWATACSTSSCGTLTRLGQVLYRLVELHCTDASGLMSQFGIEPGLLRKPKVSPLFSMAFS